MVKYMLYKALRKVPQLIPALEDESFPPAEAAPQLTQGHQGLASFPPQPLLAAFCYSSSDDEGGDAPPRAASGQDADSLARLYVADVLRVRLESERRALRGLLYLGSPCWADMHVDFRAKRQPTARTIEVGRGAQQLKQHMTDCCVCCVCALTGLLLHIKFNVLPPSRPPAPSKVMQWIKSDVRVLTLQRFGIYLVGEGDSDDGSELTTLPSSVVSRLRYHLPALLAPEFRSCCPAPALAR